MPETLAPDAGTLPSSGFVDSQIDAAFETGTTSATTGAGPGFTAPEFSNPEESIGPPDGRPPEELAPEPGQEAAAPEKEGAEATEQAPAEPADDEIGEPEITTSRDGAKKWHFSETKGKLLVSEHQELRQIREQIPEFTPEAAVEHYQGFTDLRRMNADLISGDPNRIGTFVQHLVNVAVDSGNPQAFGQMVAHGTRVLAGSAPQVFNSTIAEPIITTSFDALYPAAFDALRQAEASRDPKRISAAQAEIFRIQRTNWELTGRYKQIDDARSVDPYAQQRAELQQEERRINAIRHQHFQEQSKQWEANANAKRESAVMEIADELLSKVKEGFKDRPALLEMIRTGVLSGVEKKVSENAEWKSLYDLDMESARRSGSERDLDKAVKRYAARAKSIITSEVKRLLPQATNTVVEQNRQRHQQLANSASQKNLAGGSPVRRSIAPDLTKVGTAVKGRDPSAEIDEIFRQNFGI